MWTFFSLSILFFYSCSYVCKNFENVKRSFTKWEFSYFKRERERERGGETNQKKKWKVKLFKYNEDKEKSARIKCTFKVSKEDARRQKRKHLETTLRLADSKLIYD